MHFINRLMIKKKLPSCKAVRVLGKTNVTFLLDCLAEEMLFYRWPCTYSLDYCGTRAYSHQEILSLGRVTGNWRWRQHTALKMESNPNQTIQHWKGTGRRIWTHHHYCLWVVEISSLFIFFLPFYKSPNCQNEYLVHL